MAERQPPLVMAAGVGRVFGPAAARARGRGVRALEGVDFTVGRGEVLAVVGPNGAGKSTLLALVLGFLGATEGRIEVGGLEPREYLRRRGAGYLPERFSLPDEWPVGRALSALAGLEGASGAEASRRAEGALERWGLAAHSERRSSELSRGLLQRVGLAQALLGERELVVLDEPTEGLDPRWRLHLRDAIAWLKTEGRTVLLASHDLGEVERVADRVVVLEGGRLRRELDPRSRGTDPREYVLRLREDSRAVGEIFPGAEVLDPAGAEAPGAPSAPAAGAVYRIGPIEPRELSARLAALLESGAVLLSLEPRSEALEERVRRELRP